MSNSAAATPRTPASPGPDSEPVAITLQLAQPYLSSAQIVRLCARQRREELPEVKEQHIRLLAAQWINAVGAALQFPIRTIGTALMLFQRFHLFNPMADYLYTDTAAACLFVACKMEDTNKKLRDILIADYNLKHPDGPEINPESSSLEEHRRRIIGLERRVLQTAGFDFRGRHPQNSLIKFARYYRVHKDVASKAWDICVDAYRTFAPFKHTPQTLALAALLLAGKLATAADGAPLEFDQIPFERFHTTHANVADCVHDFLELYIHHRQMTRIGQDIPLERFMELQIELNRAGHVMQDVKVPVLETDGRAENGLDKSGRHEVIRYILDPERQRRERHAMEDLVMEG
ncbi:cyclin-like protein [Saitoella complicata NRRL Y-17804]|nr:cyclin-like protein [Saitoella complicata NRRL Y-17804]ODQ55661.1 cyclin-like protein [Saitoella complicata NRRL Y-17804]